MNRKKLFTCCILCLVLFCCIFIVIDRNRSNNPKENTFTIVWRNYDGTILETDYNVKEGTMPKYDGKKPSRQEDEINLYEFIGWNEEISTVYNDVTYVAMYKVINKQTGENTYGDLIIGDWDKIN